MKLNDNDTKLKKEEKENGIIEMPTTLKNKEWKDTGKKWIRNCPKCNNIITYSNKWHLYRGIKNNTKCFDCYIHSEERSNKLKSAKRSQETKKKISLAMRGRKITWIDKISKKLKGRIIPPEQEIRRLESRLKINYDEYCKRRPKYFDYKSKVMSITRRQPIHLLENHEKIRGLAGTKNGYQLDHIITIKDGFEKNINPHIIGNIKNLRFISWEENLKKNKKSNGIISENLKVNCLNETEKELLTSYSKFDNRLYKSMKAVTEAWYENPTISRDEALAIARKVAQL